MAGVYKRCPHCGNENEGDWIRRCDNCGLIYCDSCRDGYTFCPRCGSNSHSHIGTIE